MNPVDNNPGINPGARPQRGESEQEPGRARSAGGADRVRVERAGEPDASERPAEAGESVTLTRTASELLQLEESLQALPSVDRARVDAIRSAIENGSYRIDTARIVDSLLQSEAELR
jgi:negative regulator of flagellin synthesis FlgM